MKGKILFSSKDWNWENTKDGAEPSYKMPTYTVTKATKYGTFTNSVTVCKEDMPENISEISDLMGYDFAERKCDIDAIHAKAIILRERAEGMRIAANTLEEKYSYLDSNDFPREVLDALNHQYRIAIRDYDKVYKQYVYMRDDFRNYTDRRIKFRDTALKKAVEKA